MKGHMPKGAMSEEERRFNQGKMQNLYTQFSQEYGDDPELAKIIN